MRLRELYETINLFEAYDTKVAKLQKDFAQLRAGFPEKPKTQWGPAEPAIPGDPTVPDANQLAALVSFAEQAFKSGAKPSEQAMQWYLTLLETYYKQNDPKFAGKFAAMIGQYSFTDFNSLNEELAHFFTSEYADSQYIKDIVKAIRPATTQVDNLITNAQAAEQRIHTEAEAARKLAGRPDIELMEGDQVILPVDNKYDWWWLPHNSHEFESKAMGHCGTCQNREGNLLSLRTKKPIWPELTFEWDPTNGMLYQTKGPYNSKPAHRYQPAILTLLLSDYIKGIGNNSYQPANDFSIFDFKPNDVKTIDENKSNLIADQIVKYPIDFLRAPEFIRSNPEYRSTAINYEPGLEALVDEGGKVNTSLNAWEAAIENNHKIIIYAPDTLKDYENRVTKTLTYNTTLLGFANTKIRSNYNIMSVIVRQNPDAIETVPLRAPTYEKLAIIALGRKSRLLKAIPAENRTVEMCKTAIDSFGNEYDNSIVEFYELFNTLPFSKDDHEGLVVRLLAHDTNNELVNLIPNAFKSYEVSIALIKRTRNFNSYDKRKDIIRELFNNISPESMTHDEYLKICVEVGKNDALPEEFQTYEYFEKYLHTVRPVKTEISVPFFSDGFKKLSDEQKEHLIKILTAYCPEAYLILPFSIRISNLTRLMDVITSVKPNLTQEIASDILFAVGPGNPIPEDEKSRLLDYLKHTIESSPGTALYEIRRYLVAVLSSQELHNMYEYTAKISIGTFINALDEEMANGNDEWITKTILDAVGSNSDNHIDSSTFSGITDLYPNVAKGVFNGLSVDYIGKHLSIWSLRNMYTVDPEKFKNAVQKIVYIHPEDISSLTGLFPQYIPPKEHKWINGLYQYGFKEVGVMALVGFPTNVLTPKMLKIALDNTDANDRRLGIEEVSDRLNKLYSDIQDDPAYADIMELFIKIVPSLIKKIAPTKLTTANIDDYIDFLLSFNAPMSTVVIRLRNEPFSSAAYVNPDIKHYLNKKFDELGASSNYKY